MTGLTSLADLSALPQALIQQDLMNHDSPAASPQSTPPHATIPGVGPHRGWVHSHPAKLLGLDVGLARIGVAVCDPLQLRARPLTTITRRSRREDFDALAALVQGEEVATVVCGLPLNMDGSEGPQAATTRKWAIRFAQAMRTLTQRVIPVVFWDERLSSFTAQTLMGQAGADDQPADSAAIFAGAWNTPAAQQEDAVAAAVILQHYLDHLREPASRVTLYDAIVLPAPETNAGTSAENSA